MARRSGIEWTGATLNAATGCTEVSAGCDHCYARTLAARLQAMGQARYRNGFTYTEHPEVLDQVRHWRQPSIIFVNSMSDFFHQEATWPFVERALATFCDESRHTYQILTKRPGHIWLGTSVESAVSRCWGRSISRPGSTRRHAAPFAG